MKNRYKDRLKGNLIEYWEPVWVDRGPSWDYGKIGYWKRRTLYIFNMVGERAIKRGHIIVRLIRKEINRGRHWDRKYSP